MKHKFLLSGLMFLFSLSLFAESYSGTCGAEGDNLTWTLDTESGILIIFGTGAMKDYDASYTNNVAPWYPYRSSITSAVFSDGVTSIGIDAFNNCSSLTSIEIPNSVISIGNWAFLNCSSLTSMAIPNSVTSIGKGAFSGCSSLTSVTIPESVTSIGTSAFYNVPNIVYTGSATGSPWEARCANGYMDGYLVYSDASKIILLACFATAKGEIVIPNSVTNIGSRAFYNCSSLTSVTIPNSVTSIGDYAFFMCSSLTSVTIPSSVTSIESGAFGDCNSLTSVTIPSSVTSIESGAFEDCSSLTSVTIPNSVTSIESRAFEDCSSLISVTIPNSVTSIGSSAFSGCSSLTSVIIPNSVTSIGDWAFSRCSSLTSPVFNEHIFAYMPTSYLGDFTIPVGIKSIVGGAFYGCSSLTSVTIPHSVTSIGISAFNGCSSLTSVTIPESVTSIGSSTFYGCSSLPVIDNIRYADTYLVEATDKTLTTYTIKKGTRWIGHNAFKNCGNLTSIIIPNTVICIETGAFSGCMGLTSITCEAVTPPIGAIINNVFYDEDNVFYNVDKNIPLFIPNGSVESYKATDLWKNFNMQVIPCILSIGTCGEHGENLMWKLDCDGALTISGTGEMENYAEGSAPWYSYRESIITLTIVEGVTNLGDAAFFGCHNMKTVTIPGSVTSLGIHAFRECDGMTSITCKAATPPSLGKGVFNGVDKSIPLYVTTLSINAYKEADQWKDFMYVMPEYLANNQIFCIENGINGMRDQYQYGRDSIILDTYTVPNAEDADWLQYTGSNSAPKVWAYNKFVRVRAWSKNTENKDNYIQLYFWVGDTPEGKTQQYTNGVGPKAGEYTLTQPQYGEYYFNKYDCIYYWTLTQKPVIKPILIGFTSHSLPYTYNESWICPFSSYVTNVYRPADVISDVISFNSLIVTVAKGDNGNMYIQIGNQNPSVTIGSRTTYNLTPLVKGEGTVHISPDCENHIAGETVNLVPVPSNPIDIFKGWTGDDASVVTDNGNGTYTITMPSHDVNLTAVFAAREECNYETTDGATVWEDELPYTWESVTFNQAGTETLTLQASDGCDSVVTFTLRVRHRNIVLQENEDAQYYDFFAEDYNGYTVNTATLNRRFTQGKWATLCLPFHVNKAMMTALGLYNRVFELRYAETEGTTVTVYFAVAKSIEAGKGYIVNANARLADKTSFVFPNVTIITDADNEDITALTGYNDGSGRGSLYLVGTLRTGRLTGSADGSTYLGLKDNVLYYPNSTTGTSVRAYRGFFRSGAVNVEIGDGGDEEALLPQRVRVMIDGVESGEWRIDNGEFAIDNGELRMDNSQAVKFIDNGILYIRLNGRTYNAQGQRID